MRKSVNHQAMFAVGYFNHPSVRAGEVLHFHASSICPAPQVSIVSLDRPLHPAGFSGAVLTTLAVEAFEAGSWLEVGIDPTHEQWQLSFSFELQSLAAGCLLAIDDIQLLLSAEGQASLRHDLRDTPGPQLPLRQWIDVELKGNAQGIAIAFSTAISGVLAGAELQVALAMLTNTERRIVIGSDRDICLPSLNTKIANIRYSDAAGESHWGIPLKPTLELPDSNGLRPAISVQGSPKFSVTGPRWDGTTLDPRVAPEHYACLQLHEDDQAPFDWPASVRVQVPPDAVPGVYGLTLSYGGLSETFPFVVRAAKASAKICFLLPTLTYHAYANENLPEALFPWLVEDRGHRFAQDNGWLSLYDQHRDGSGVSWASWPKPWVTVRADYQYPLCGGPHGFPVDLHALQFFAERGTSIEVITDHDLDREGFAALAGCTALLTGSHPEYWTRPMHEALQRHLEMGGSLAYLGGNGFYWATAADATGVEVHRGVSGTRTWEGRAGEEHLALNGEPGGLWRWRGRPEHRLTGVGSCGMGFTHALPYQRLADSYGSEVAWLFRGLAGASIDAPGILLGGPAGYEIDCVSQKWGTPAGTLLLAEAGPFISGYVWEDGELYSPQEPQRLVAHMTLRHTAAGGIVFATGSVSWLGALPAAGGQNDVGRVTGNLLDFFQAMPPLPDRS